jgi:site-specific recombinase XerD
MRLRGSNLDRNSINYREISSFKTPRDELILEILFNTGITASELVNIKVQDISFSKNNIKIQDKKTRTLLLNDNLVNLLKDYIQKNKLISNDFLFKTRQSPYITVRRLEQILSNYKLTPQEIRKHYLEKALKSGQDRLAIKKQLGIDNLPKKKYVSKEIINQVRSKVKSIQHSLILELLWQTGITVNELVNLKKSDFSFGQNILIIRPEITKSKLPRAIMISQELSSKIQSFTKSFSLRSFIFSSQKSSQISALRVRQILAYYSELASLDEAITPQLLRNSHIVFAHSSGESLSSISERLGIKQLNTNSYGSLLFEDREIDNEKNRERKAT